LKVGDSPTRFARIEHLCYFKVMHRQETVIVAIKKPTACKSDFLDAMAYRFCDAVQIALNAAQALRTSSRKRIHDASYAAIRTETEIASEYARMAVNEAVALARSYYGLRKSKRQKRTSFPTANSANHIGLGVKAYAVVKRDTDFVLRMTTGERGNYVWLPLSVCARFRDKMQYVSGDARLFRRHGQWYVMLPLKIPHTPTVRDGEPTFIGVDLGIVRLATVSTPDGVSYFDGKEARHRREHFANLRRRYQRANRLDKVKEMQGKERRWMTNLNHIISARLVQIALSYENPVIVFERLDGIRDRVRASKRFNRMMSSWAFRQLVEFVSYKADRHGIPVLFVDPRRTSRTCPRCGHATRSNRPSQALFRCVRCGFCDNADAVASANIAGSGARLHYLGPPDMALSDSSDTTGTVGFWPDGVQDRRAARLDPTLVSSL
jgi:IS605 OrfB family transposase